VSTVQTCPIESVQLGAMWARAAMEWVALPSCELTQPSHWGLTTVPYEYDGSHVALKQAGVTVPEPA
jgi:hypothetical protein